MKIHTKTKTGTVDEIDVKLARIGNEESLYINRGNHIVIDLFGQRKGEAGKVFLSGYVKEIRAGLWKMLSHRYIWPHGGEFLR